MNTKEIIKDKAIDASKIVMEKSAGTARGVYKSGEDMARSLSSIVVNYAPDPYDQLQDLSTDGTKQLASHTVMVTRAGARSIRSIKNIHKKSKVQNIWIQKHWSRLSEQEKVDILAKSGLTRTGSSAEDIQNAKKRWGKEVWKKENRKSKWGEYQKAGIKKGLNIQSSGVNMIQNQSRKMINHIAYSDDLSSKAIGKTAKLGWSSWRYRRQFKNIYSAVRKAASVIKVGISSIISFVVSIPGLIATFSALVPVLICLFVIIAITSLFTDIEYSGRVHEFTENEVYLEYRYAVNVVPDEILAITSVLGWSSQELEDYEALFAIMFDGVANNGIMSFDRMCENVFRKYNPALYKFKPSTLEYKTTGSWFGEYKTAYITKDLWQNIYPNYYKGSQAEKNKFGSAAYIAELKSKTRDALEINSKNYVATYLNETDMFKTDPLKLDTINRNASTYHMGIRNLLKDKEFHAGVDIAAAKGTPVYSVMNAEVVHSQSNIVATGDACVKNGSKKKCGAQLAGNQVVLKKKTFDENGDTTYLYVSYYHLNNAVVQTGQKVKAGQVIGYVGDTGMAYGDHLHFQAWTDSVSYKGSNYKMPYSTVTADFNLWQEYIDASMFCTSEFKNKIYGR